MNHTESSNYAGLAEIALKDNEPQRAIELYRLAAEKEVDSLKFLDLNKVRTLGVTVVSAVSLYYKANEFEKAEHLSHQYLANENLPSFAVDQLKDLLQTIWNEKILHEYNIQFTKGEVLVSVSGGEVVTGGAPLELVLGKVNEISRYFYRTIEMLLHKPLRKRGNPDNDIMQQCRPWLFQAPPGSYQFAVRVRKPLQQNLFEDEMPQIEEITNKFIEIISATSQGDSTELEKVVPDEEYRETFLKMTRNLAPTGKSFGKLVVRQTGNSDLESVVLIPDSREIINEVIKIPKINSKKHEEKEERIRLIGILRGLHLDKDWIEVTVNKEDKEEHIKISKTGEVVDDIIGSMVNRQVIVDTLRNSKGTYYFKDIQIDE